MATSALDYKPSGKFMENSRVTSPKGFPSNYLIHLPCQLRSQTFLKSAFFSKLKKIYKIASTLASNTMIWILNQRPGICGTFRWVTTSGSQLQGLLLSRLSGCYVTDHEVNKWPQKRPKIVPKMTQLIVVTPTQLPLTIKLWLNLS